MIFLVTNQINKREMGWIAYVTFHFRCIEMSSGGCDKTTEVKRSHAISAK